MVARATSVAMHPHEAGRIALLELAQRAGADMAVPGGTYRRVFRFRLEAEHLRERHPLGAPPLLDQEGLRQPGHRQRAPT